ncbi:pilus assembly PilX family protein [Acidihalobacter prosperus]|nr:PilX N-terminal domain-containing pilus assembly protein [Acidihalobacter prosperus]
MNNARHAVDASCRTHARERGFALVVSLLILVILTLLGVSMFGNVGLQERMAGNTREKNRAFAAAQTALQYAQWWLTQGANATQGVVCNNAPSPSAPIRVCSNQLSSATTVPWTTASTYQPQSGVMTFSSSGGVNTYNSAPQFYIQYIGPGIGTGGSLYRITAWGSGGNANAVAVVQSVYLVGGGGGGHTAANNLGGS